ncbi:MAG: threonylcarbamoyl-AMP synthase [Pseudomonadales bacterium]|nr:threonylcarbamoyl-AMP synthase [Pseudomonadales bacterium]
MSIETIVLKPDDGLTKATDLLLSGDCVALPTETVYGLAADASNEKAVRKVFEAKGRPLDHPLIVHIPGADHIKRWAIDVPELAYKLAEQFWPGPLTLLLSKSPDVSSVVTGGLDTIALRVPEHPLFLDILRQADFGLAAPSANRYKKLSPTTANQVFKGMQGRIKAVLDGGPCEFGLESTIVDLTSAAPTVLRAGPITRAMLESAAGITIEQPESHNVAVPGNVAAHYQPGTRLREYKTQDLASDDAPSCCYLFYSEEAGDLLRKAEVDPSRCLKVSDDCVEYGKTLYSALHKLDEGGYDEIRIEATPRSERWAAINDRLRRAQGD